VLCDPGANSRVLSWEGIANADPDVVIVAPCGYDLRTAQAAVAALPPAAAAAFRALRAVRTGRAWVMDGNAFVNRPGPRLVDTAELFAATIDGSVSGDSDAIARVAPAPGAGSERPGV